MAFPPSKIVIQQNWSSGSSADDKRVRIPQGRCLFTKELDLQRGAVLLCSQWVAEGACAPCACLLPVAPGRAEGLCAARSCFCSPQGKSSYGSPENCGKCWAASGSREYKRELLPASAGLVQPVPTGPKCVTHDIFNQSTSVSICSHKLNQQWCGYIIFFAFSCIRKLGFSWVWKMCHVLWFFFWAFPNT